MISNKASLIVVCLCFYTLSAYPSPVKKFKNVYSNCGTPDDAKRMEIKSITITPTKPKKGDEVAIAVDSVLKEEVTSGEVKLSLKYGRIPIVYETLNFCDLVTQVNKQCPLKKGPFRINSDKHYLPDYMPSGNYKGKLLFNDQNGKEMMCAKFDLVIK